MVVQVLAHMGWAGGKGLNKGCFDESFGWKFYCRRPEEVRKRGCAWTYVPFHRTVCHGCLNIHGDTAGGS